MTYFPENINAETNKALVPVKKNSLDEAEDISLCFCW